MNLSNDAYVDGYYEINNGAHLKAANLIGAPSFVWNLAFWNPIKWDDAEIPVNCDSDQLGLVEILTDKWKARIDTINRYIGLIVNNIRSEFVLYRNYNDDEFKVEELDRNRVVTIHFVWHRMLAKIRIEVHTEYISISSSVDASFDINADTREEIRNAKDDGTKSYTEEYLLRFDKLISENNYSKDYRGWEHREEYDSHFSYAQKDTDISEAKVLFDYFYGGIWEKFYAQVLNPHGVLMGGATCFQEKKPIIGQIFSDCRGFVTCKWPDENELRPAYPAKPAAKGEWRSIRKPFYRTHYGQRPRPFYDCQPTKEWARSRLDKTWVFLEPAIRHTSFPPRVEYSISRLLDGRMLFASAFGPQTRVRPTPGYFYIHSSTECERQIGRVVERICRSATLRLASILVVPGLRPVAISLRAIDVEIRKARADVHNLIAKMKEIQVGHGGTSHNRLANIDFEPIYILERELLKTLDRIRLSIAGLSSGKDNKYAHVIGGDTLEQRLVRSKYYRGMLDSIWKSLRIKRLEGYQPYDSFLKRRMESTFGYMETIEARLKHVREEWRHVDQLYLTTVVTLLTAQINFQQERANKIQKSIELIQEIGDVALTTVILPYYLIGTPEHIAEAMKRYEVSADIQTLASLTFPIFYVAAVYFFARGFGKICKFISDLYRPINKKMVSFFRT